MLHRLVPVVAALYTTISLCLATNVNATASLIVQEYCNMETFNATCSSPGEVVLIRRARYGRMQVGRCVQRNLGYIGCNTDVLGLLDARCSGRRRCEFSLPDQELYKTEPCPKDITPYLEVAYECLKVIGNDGCTTSEPIIQRDAVGYIQTAPSHELLDNSIACRWSIQAEPGQRINLTLYYFGRAVSSPSLAGSSQGIVRGDMAWNNNVCYDLASVTEPGMSSPKRFNTCTQGRTPGVRERHLFESTKHIVELQLTGNAVSRQELGRFLIKYEVVSCPNLAPPKDGKATRDGDTLVMTCNHSMEVWSLTCNGLTWIGKHGNCSHMSSSSAKVQSTGFDSFPYGILIVVAVGVALGVLLGGLLLIFVVLYMRRRHRRPCDDLSPPVTSSTPTRMLTSSPCRQFRPVCPATHLHQVDKYSGGCWFESTLRSSGLGSTMTPGSCGPHQQQMCWDQTVKFMPADEDDLLTTPDAYSSDRSWTRLGASRDGMAVNL